MAPSVRIVDPGTTMRCANSTSSSVAGRSATSSRIRPSLLPPLTFSAATSTDKVPVMVAVGADHGAAQLVHPGPGSLVGAEPEHPLQPLRGDAVLLRGDEPDRREPRRQRR